MNDNIIRYIYNGRQYIIRIKYICDYYNMKLYVSDDISELQVLKLVDNTIFIIADNNYEYTKDKIKYEIKIWNGLLQIYFNTLNNRAIDIYLAYWFGFKNTIEVIKEIENIDENTRKSRVELLETLLKENKSLELISKEDILRELHIMEI